LDSHEEDTQYVRVYRPAEYDFPLSRGRTDFEFREGGELIYYEIARADGTELSRGYEWRRAKLASSGLSLTFLLTDGLNKGDRNEC
jgi:hypothetical protein